MRREVFDQFQRGWVRVQQVVVADFEEPPVRIEGGFEQLGDEFPEEAASVDPSLVQTREVHELNLDLQLQVRFCKVHLLLDMK